jgi:hypothetical protein
VFFYRSINYTVDERAEKITGKRLWQKHGYQKVKKLSISKVIKAKPSHRCFKIIRQGFWQEQGYKKVKKHMSISKIIKVYTQTQMLLKL